MSDRVVDSAWWASVMGLICVTAGGTLLAAYQGLLRLLSHDWPTGAGLLLLGASLAVGCVFLCRHRNDLV